MLSVAVNQPVFEDDDLGFFQAIAPIIGGLISAGGSIVTSKINAKAITEQVKAQTQAQRDIAVYRAQAEAASMPSLSSMEWIMLAAVGVLVVTQVMKK